MRFLGGFGEVVWGILNKEGVVVLHRFWPDCGQYRPSQAKVLALRGVSGSRREWICWQRGKLVVLKSEDKNTGAHRLLRGSRVSASALMLLRRQYRPLCEDHCVTNMRGWMLLGRIKTSLDRVQTVLAHIRDGRTCLTHGVLSQPKTCQDQTLFANRQ